MNRTTRYKLGALLVLLALAAGAWWLVGSGGGLMSLIAFALILMIPGRLQGHFYRDLFRGRRLLAEGKLEASLEHSERFLATVRRRPGLKPLLWLGWSVYTPDVEAMTLNNIGAACLSLGRLEAATKAFEEALRIDPQYPIPFFNLAVVRQVQGDSAEAARLQEKASKLGYTQGSTDRLVQSAQAVLARVEGAGPASSAIIP